MTDREIVNRMAVVFGTSDIVPRITEELDPELSAALSAISELGPDKVRARQESPEEKWAEVPGIFREQTMNAAAFHERYIRDLRECLYEKAIANASIHESDPKAWEKTVDKAITWAFLLGDLVGGASTAGFPRAEEIRANVAPSPDNPRHPPYDPRKEQAS